MPGGLYFADQTLPRVTDGMSTEEQVERMLAFLYQLTDQLRYLFENAALETARDTISRQNGELRLYLGNGDCYSFRPGGIYYVSGETEKRLVNGKP